MTSSVVTTTQITKYLQRKDRETYLCIKDAALNVPMSADF